MPSKPAAFSEDFTEHTVATREEWRAARDRPLQGERQLVEPSNAITEERRALP